MERVGLTQTERLHEDTLGALDHLSSLQRLAQVADLTLQGAELVKTSDREIERGAAIAGLADYVVTKLGQHLAQVEPDQRLVIGDQHTPRAGGAWGLAHGRGPQRLRPARQPHGHGYRTTAHPPP